MLWWSLKWEPKKATWQVKWFFFCLGVVRNRPNGEVLHYESGQRPWQPRALPSTTYYRNPALNGWIDGWKGNISVAARRHMLNFLIIILFFLHFVFHCVSSSRYRYVLNIGPMLIRGSYILRLWKRIKIWRCHPSSANGPLWTGSFFFLSFFLIFKLFRLDERLWLDFLGGFFSIFPFGERRQIRQTDELFYGTFQIFEGLLLVLTAINWALWKVEDRHRPYSTYYKRISLKCALESHGNFSSEEKRDSSQV